MKAPSWRRAPTSSRPASPPATARRSSSCVEGSAAEAAAASDAALAGLTVYPLSDRVAAKVTTLETAPDVMAVFPLPRPVPLDALSGTASLVVYADRIGDPGNMGTLLRAAAAFGAAAVVAAPASVDLYGPKTVRASMGAVFGLPLYQDVRLARW